MTLSEFLDDWQSESDSILVHTSGSTGKPKPLVVEKKRMEASARMTCRFLGLQQGDSALLCMPLDYIAGKMVVVRSIVMGLRLINVEPCGHPLHSLKDIPDFAAMVPLQVTNSLEVPEERRMLMKIKNLIIGGGSIDKGLADELKGFPNAVWSTYGMTETLSHIAMRRLNGENASEWYTPLDGVNVSLNNSGCLVIDAPYVCDKPLETNDIAVIDDTGKHFKIIGRKDNVIDSGGIKIQMEDVENMLHDHIGCPYMITKKQDRKFGEIVVLLIQGCNDVSAIKETCEKVLPKYWLPKLYISVPSLPVTDTGKPARAEAERLACTLENEDARLPSFSKHFPNSIIRISGK